MTGTPSPLSGPIRVRSSPPEHTATEQMPQSHRPKDFDILDRRRRALELRKEGLTFEAIAEIVADEFKLPNYSRPRAYDDVSFSLAELAREYRGEAESLRQLELERLDTLQNALWPAATNGDDRAIGAIMKLMERRSKLLGLDAPVQLLVEQIVDRELREAVDQLQKAMSPAAYREFLDAMETLKKSS